MLTFPVLLVCLACRWLNKIRHLSRATNSIWAQPHANKLQKRALIGFQHLFKMGNQNSGKDNSSLQLPKDQELNEPE